MSEVWVITVQVEKQ